MWLPVAFGWRFTPAPPGFYPGRPCWKCRVTRLTRHGCSVWFCRLAGVLDGANGFSFPKPRAPRILLTHLLQVCPRVCNSRPLVSLGSRRSSEPHDREALQPGLPCSVRQEASVCRPRPPLSLNLRGSWVCTYLRAEGAVSATSAAAPCEVEGPGLRADRASSSAPRASRLSGFLGASRVGFGDSWRAGLPLCQRGGEASEASVPADGLSPGGAATAGPAPTGLAAPCEAVAAVGGRAPPGPVRAVGHFAFPVVALLPHSRDLCPG